LLQSRISYRASCASASPWMSIERSQRCGYALGSIALMGLWLHNLVNFSENLSKNLA
jgi:hypothetical protein